MKFLELSIISFGLTIGASYGQVADSVLYTIRIGKIKKLVEIALHAKACDEVVTAQESTINAGLKLQESTDSLLSIRTRELALCDSARADYRDLYTNQILLTRIEKKKKRKWVFIGITALAIAVAEFAKGL